MEILQLNGHVLPAKGYELTRDGDAGAPYAVGTLRWWDASSNFSPVIPLYGLNFHVSRKGNLVIEAQTDLAIFTSPVIP